MKCRRCEDRGFYYDKKIFAHQVGELRLCTCIEETCKCAGTPPYQYFDEEGDFHWCPCRKHRLDMRKTERLLAQANVPKKYQWRFLDDFREKGPDNRVIKDAKRLKGYISSLLDCYKSGQPGRGYVFWGNPGNGKTMLACIALNELMLWNGKQGQYIDLSFQYFQRLRSTYSEESEIYGRASQIIEELTSVSFLVIDDFGVQRNTEWEKEMLYNLIDSRYSEEKVTFITTNKNISDIRELLDGRIYSRLVEMCHVVHVTAPDYRLRYEKAL